MEKWSQINKKMIPYAILIVTGLVVSVIYGNVTHGRLFHRLLSLAGVICFVLAAVILLNILSEGVKKTIIYRHLGEGRAASLQFLIRTIGYLTILFVTLGRIGVPVGHILLGSALLGIILGVAAQQALANFFASIVLIVAHPFEVGQDITLVSGALGGKYEGTVKDIGLTHTKLRQDNGEIVELPNSTILVGGAITVHKHKKES